MAYSLDIPSKRLIASYVFDWVCIIIIAAAGGGLNFVSPYHRPFSLLDLSISYPLVDESITARDLALFGLIAPLVVIALVVTLFVPGPHYCKTHTRGEIVRRKLWEAMTGALGLCLSLATAFFATQALKNIFGKPRPDLLARCIPDLDAIADHIVGGYGRDISIRWTLVNSGLCTQTDSSVLDDGFRSWPSGHASWSWASMLYLSLFLCSKFAIAIPFLAASPSAHDSSLNRSDTHEMLPLHRSHHHPNEDAEASNKPPSPVQGALPGPSPSSTSTRGRVFVDQTPIYNQAAAPPVWGIIVIFIPIGVALYVVSTRYVEFYHAGFDVISGSLIGILAAYAAFRWYHAPIRSGAGWAWGPRSRDRAWGIGVGTYSYVGDEGWDPAKRARRRPPLQNNGSDWGRIPSAEAAR